MKPLISRIADILEAHGYEWPTKDKKRPPTLALRRVYAGRHQRSAGAWSWFLWSTDPNCDGLHAFSSVGSRWPATDLVRWGKDGTELHEQNNYTTGSTQHIELWPTKESLLRDIDTRKKKAP